MHAVAPSSTRVVIAHDYLTQRGGAERVVLALLEAFPGARVVTSVYAPDTTYPEFRDVEIETLPLDRFRLFRRDPRLAFPLLARAWSRHTITDADIVICSSSGWAHGVGSTAPKIVYCHNPARWLYQAADYLGSLGGIAKLAQRVLAKPLMTWDRRHAAEAAEYLANSNAVAGRILGAYGRDSLVVPPPVTLDPAGPQEPVSGLQPGFLLNVARARGYKNTEIVCQAVEQLADERMVVIGDLPQRADGVTWSDRLTGVGRVSDAQLRWLYANCSALVSASREDFGLTPIEAHLFGRPAVLLRAGGFLDTLVDGMTGCFIEEETVEAIVDALQRRPVTDPDLLRTYASGFRPAVFARRISEAIDRVLGASVPVHVPAQATARRALRSSARAA